MVAEKTDNNTVRYIRGYELISSDSEAAKTYYHYVCDEMGSITHITDDEGNILNRYEYDAFGNFTLKEETIENRFGFTGEQYDPVAGLYYLRARFYNPVIGRFIQEDTYYGDGLNLYNYCQNNPVRYVDPSGFARKTCPEKESAINTLTEAGFTKEQAESYYRRLKDKNGKDTAIKEIKDKYVDRGSSGSSTAQTPRTPAEWEEYFKEKYGSKAVKYVPNESASTSNPTFKVSRKQYPNHARMLENAKNKGHSLTNLTRGSGTRAAQKNRYESQKAIRKQQGGPPTGFDYDEFPYASTKQGGAGAHVEPVPSAENQAAGRDLGQFYREYNIHEDDLFDVEIID